MMNIFKLIVGVWLAKKFLIDNELAQKIEDRIKKEIREFVND